MSAERATSPWNQIQENFRRIGSVFSLSCRRARYLRGAPTSAWTSQDRGRARRRCRTRAWRETPSEGGAEDGSRLGAVSLRTNKLNQNKNRGVDPVAMQISFLKD